MNERTSNGAGHHAFVIEAPTEEGISFALQWLERETGLIAKGNPDVAAYRFGLFSVEDARAVAEGAAGVPLRGDAKAVIIAASRAYHEAQNALLKLFEEPPEGTYLFLILPSLGGLLPTLRSRVQELKHEAPRLRQGAGGQGSAKHEENPAEEFLKGSREKRSAIVKRLTSGKDEDDRRENRDQAIELLSGIEAVLAQGGRARLVENRELLEEIALFRGYLYERSAPVKMILEHLAIVTPKV